MHAQIQDFKIMFKLHDASKGTVWELFSTFLGGLHVTNPPIRLMCPMSDCPSTFLFPDSNSKTLCSIEFKLDRDIDLHHS